MTNLFKTASKLGLNGITGFDPMQLVGNAIAKNNPNNKGVAFFDPGGAQTNRLQQGEGITPKLVGDPGQFFAPSEKNLQTTRAAAAAAAIPMPYANDQEVQLARRRAAALQQQRGGRASTILTGTTDSLGG